MSIADAVTSAGTWLTEHPNEARYRDTHAWAHLGDELRVDVTGPNGETLTTDMPRGIGGTGSNPSPGWYLRAAMASCVASLIAIRAAATGVSLGGVDVEVDSESDDRGILGLEHSVPAGPLSVKVAVTIDAPSVDRAVVEALATWALAHCPVSDAVARAIPVSLEVR